jgi:hypothetical protein
LDRRIAGVHDAHESRGIRDKRGHGADPGSLDFERQGVTGTGIMDEKDGGEAG